MTDDIETIIHIKKHELGSKQEMVSDRKNHTQEKKKKHKSNK